MNAGLSSFNSSRRWNQDVWMPWLICLSAGLFFFYEFFQLNVFDVINSALRDEFHLDAPQLGWLSSTFVFANVVFLLPAGVILDRCSIRWVMLSALSLCVFGTFGFAFSHVFWWSAFFHALTGIGNAFCFLSCVILVSRWFPPQRQAFVIGCLVTMAFLGGMMAHTPLAFLIAHAGWRHALIVDGAVGVFILGWIAYIVKDHASQFQSHRKASVQGQWLRQLKDACLNRQNWLAGIYTSCLNLPIMVLCALWGASYLNVVHHVTPLAASHIVSQIFAGSIVGCPLVGWLSDRHGRRKPMMILGAIATCLTLLPLLSSAELSEQTLSVLCFALGFFTSTQVISYPLIAESNSATTTGAATGVASILIVGGGGVGQILFGFLLQHHAGHAVTHYSITDFQFAIWMFPISALIAFIMMIGMKETYCNHKGAVDAIDGVEPLLE